MIKELPHRTALSICLFFRCCVAAVQNPVIFSKDCILDLISGFRKQRMSNITEVAFSHLMAWHGHKETVLTFDNLNVVYDELIIKKEVTL